MLISDFYGHIYNGLGDRFKPSLDTSINKLPPLVELSPLGICVTFRHADAQADDYDDDGRRTTTDDDATTIQWRSGSIRVLACGVVEFALAFGSLPSYLTVLLDVGSSPDRTRRQKRHTVETQLDIFGLWRGVPFGSYALG